jgi:hypothetical protein
MTAAVHLGDVPAFLDRPEPTETKLGRAWGRGIDWDGVAEAEPKATVAPLRPRRLTEDAARAPKWRTGSFRCPLGMRGPVFNAHVTEQVKRWIEAERKLGFDVWSSTRIKVVPGPYPARDLLTGLLLLGEREMLVQAEFVERQPEIVRLELPGELFRPWRADIRHGVLSGDEGA